MKSLLSDAALERSPVVANSLMNRERGLSGVNSYARELGFDIAAFLVARLEEQEHVAWLDLCCGAGRALSQAAEQFAQRGLLDRVRLEGVDLAAALGDCRSGAVRWHAASLHDWSPRDQATNGQSTPRYNLITCVHGLHYLGDKLGLVARAATWLTVDGLFLANLDPKNLCDPHGRPLGKRLTRAYHDKGVQFHRRMRVLRIEGARNIQWPFRYLGADDQAGPNCTGQAAIDSYYGPLV